MSSNAIDHVSTSAVAVPARIGQATAVEQSRAVAEVQAAIVVAQQCPRSIQNAIAEMRASCSRPGLAERAFYRFPRAGGAVTGPTVHLARELARCWGNVQYGIAELRRDDDGAGQSEMQAFAWDVQTNTRSVQTFIVPHVRDKRKDGKDGKDVIEPLVSTRDIYENNANNGARRVRQAIFSILPTWFTEEAQEICHKTLADGGGKSLPQRIADAIAAFAGLGVTADQLETKLDRKSDKWTDHDVAQLIVIFKSLQRGEISKDVEFAPERVTSDEITGQSANGSGATRSQSADMGGADPANDTTVPPAAQTKPSGWGDGTQVAQPANGGRKARQS